MVKWAITGEYQHGSMRRYRNTCQTDSPTRHTSVTIQCSPVSGYAQKNEHRNSGTTTGHSTTTAQQQHKRPKHHRPTGEFCGCSADNRGAVTTASHAESLLMLCACVRYGVATYCIHRDSQHGGDRDFCGAIASICCNNQVATNGLSAVQPTIFADSRTGTVSDREATVAYGLQPVLQA